MGWLLDGKVSAVLGTHTHVATADSHVLPSGTAYITDVGMTGPHDSVIGMEKQGILEHFLDTMPSSFVVAEGDIQMNAVLIDVDESTGRADDRTHQFPPGLTRRNVGLPNSEVRGPSISGQRILQLPCTL